MKFATKYKYVWLSLRIKWIYSQQVYRVIRWIFITKRLNNYNKSSAMFEFNGSDHLVNWP